MAVLEIKVWPAKVLETRAVEVETFDDEFKKFVADMHETMNAENGIGLAANQVGVLKRVLTIKIPYLENRYSEQEEQREWWHDKVFTFVNPKIVKKEGRIRYQEGCLSFPEIFDFVDRAEQVWIQAQDENGQTFEVHATGLLSICLQHEIDHLDGIVFISRMSPLKNRMIRKKMLRRGELVQ